MAKLAVTSAEKNLYDELLGSTSEDSGVVKCGGLMCQRDSTLKSFTSEVAAIARGDKGNKTFVVFKDSVFFPTGGGQPFDTGKLVWGGDAKKECVVWGATNWKGVNVVALKGSAEGLAVGVECVQHLDWSRRWYHTQSHTSQHILSACAMLHDIDTHSWDLNDGGVSVDFKGDNIEKMLSEIEEASNVVVGKDLKVEASWLEVGSEEFKSTVRSRLLPAGLTGPIRVVDIPTVDKSTCCGTHLSSTQQAGLIKILNFAKAGKGIIRVNFGSGDFLRRQIEDYCLHVGKLGVLVKDKNLEKQYAKIEGVVEEKEKLKKGMKSLWSELASLKSENMIASALTTYDINKGLTILDLNETEADRDICKDVSTLYLRGLGGKTGVCVILAGISPMTTYIQESEGLGVVDRLGKEVVGMLGGKGGGKKGVVMGKGGGRDAVEEVKRVLLEGM
ncbi:hypothetical protein TrLO_g7212 [Triparma laevis f. longispina]|uniref:Threonyl/alanyl tRNA synthetase SAD domain-containing protein n=1 Tax=Triparma laevis f. longispina TaxID=1714387 RepID=A0A9W6ZH69_9STRA|nr:hypothetical protein TrLO_g7212 [Triparma laevis f. longispina]